MVLRNLKLPSAGQYRCEISAEAPLFNTVSRSSRMEIVGEYIIITCIQIIEERGTAPFARVFFPVFVGPPCPMYQKQTATALFEQRQDSNSLIQINKTVAQEVTLI